MTGPTREDARNIWVEGPDSVLVVLQDHDALLRALRRIHDATGPEDEGRPTTLGYIRGQALDALARHTDRRTVVVGDVNAPKKKRDHTPLAVTVTLPGPAPSLLPAIARRAGERARARLHRGTGW